jgi:proline dehydrogenase
MSFEAYMRKTVLRIADRSWVRNLFTKYGMKYGVQRFVAGETLDGTVLQVRRLNEQGLSATLDLLGESVYEQKTAEQSVAAIIDALKTIKREGLDSHISVKLTQLGLCLDAQFCLSQMRQICDAAVMTGNFIRIDMEDSSVTQITIDLFRILLEEYGSERIGLVIQSYLYRSLPDVNELGKLGANLRIVKGAYNESVKVAFPLKKSVNLQYMSLVKMHLTNGCYTAIATHDENMIKPLKAFAEQNNIPKDRFEFQMLYGVSTRLQLKLIQEGYRVRVYTPFGVDWYPYFTRRIAERPANLLFVLKSLLKR